MRLTKHLTNKEIDLYNNKRTYAIKFDVGTLDIENKLGQYEDIEEELGIDLITLFKALKNGIYVIKHFNEYTYVSYVPRYDLYFSNVFSCLLYFYQTADDYDNEVYQYRFYLKDYGKIWALTKEELL